MTSKNLALCKNPYKNENQWYLMNSTGYRIYITSDRELTGEYYYTFEDNKIYDFTDCYGETIKELIEQVEYRHGYKIFKWHD